MTISALEMNEDCSPLLANILPLLPKTKIPLHVNVEPQLSIPNDLVKLSLETPSPTKVAVRIRPLGPAEIDAGEKCCIRPVLPNSNSRDPNKSCHSNKGILSPSTLHLNGSNSRNRTFPANKVSSEGSKHIDNTPTTTTGSTSLISGTEREVQFDFDQVIGPHTTQEQCYEGLVREALLNNIKLGKDTTIIVLGPKESGKTFTIHGDWKFKSSNSSNNVGENNHLDNKNCLVATAGILPRAVYDLFEASKQQQNPYTSAIFMACYMVAYEGGYTRDLLSRVDGNVVKEVIKGVSYVHVDSPRDVQQIMDRSFYRFLSEKQKGKNFHFFTSFRVCCQTKSASSWQAYSKLTLVNLTTTSTPPVEPPERYYQENLREILHDLSIPPEGNRPETGRKFASLCRRLDDALFGVTSTVLIACLSPIESEMETSTDILHFCALARGATYFKEEPGSSWRSISTTSMGDQSTFSSEAGESSGTMSARLSRTIHQADDTSINYASKGTKYNSHRNKLSRASTLAALSLMSTMTATTKGVQKTSGKVMQSVAPRGPRSREKVDSAMSPRTMKNIRYSRRNGPRLLRENEKLKSEIGKLRKESELKSERINRLESELVLVNIDLLQERQISSKLEDIRDLLKRKASLQEQRIQILEQKNSPQSSDRHPDSQSSILKLQSICSPVQGGYNADIESKASQDGLFNLSGNNGKVLNNMSMLASLDGSLEGDAIYLSGDETASGDSRPSLSYLQTVSLASGWSNPIETTTNGLVSLDDVTKCGCQRMLLTSDYNDKIEFYLPRLRVSCLCGRQQLKMSSFSEDFVRIESFFRPWQAEFLTSVGIVEVDQFIEMHHEEEKELVRKLRKWRKRKKLEVMSKVSCAVALRVWARACSVATRCRGGSVPLWTSGREDTHDLLDISSMGSSLGF